MARKMHALREFYPIPIARFADFYVQTGTNAAYLQ
jgi:hypothetical protein